jgi:hypothetical protein
MRRRSRRNGMARLSPLVITSLRGHVSNFDQSPSFADLRQGVSAVPPRFAKSHHSFRHPPDDRVAHCRRRSIQNLPGSIFSFQEWSSIRVGMIPAARRAQPRPVAPWHRRQALGMAGLVDLHDAVLHVDLHRLPTYSASGMCSERSWDPPRTMTATLGRFFTMASLRFQIFPSSLTIFLFGTSLASCGRFSSSIGRTFSS